MRLDILTTEENGTFVATCPKLPGCTTRGADLQETLEKHTLAIWGYLASVTNFLPARLELHVGDEMIFSTPPDTSYPQRLSA